MADLIKLLKAALNYLIINLPKCFLTINSVLLLVQTTLLLDKESGW